MWDRRRRSFRPTVQVVGIVSVGITDPVFSKRIDAVRLDAIRGGNDVLILVVPRIQRDLIHQLLPIAKLGGMGFETKA